jgi:hypothetical protein
VRERAQRRVHRVEGRRGHVRLVICIVLAVLAVFVAAGRKFVEVHHRMHGDVLVNDVLSLALNGIRKIVQREFGIPVVWGSPRFGEVRIVNIGENIIKRKFDGGARNAESTSRRGADTFPVIHASRLRRCWIQKCSWIEIIRKKRRKDERRTLLWVNLRIGRGCWWWLSATLGERRVLVIGVPDIGGDLGVIVSRGPPSLVRMAFELGGWLHIRLSDRGIAPGRGYGGVDTEGKLHALDGARFGILASLAAAFFFDRTLAQQVGGVVALEVGSLKLLDAPVGIYC